MNGARVGRGVRQSAGSGALGRIAAGFIVAGLLTACRQAPSAVTTTPPPAASGAFADPAPALPAALPTATPRPSPTVEPAPTAAPRLTPTPWPLAGDPCGVLLPLRPIAGATPVATPDAGQSLDEVPESAREAVRWLLLEPQDVALVAFRVGQEAHGVYHNADVSMPLASVAKLITLIAYAEAVAAREVDPAAWVPLEALDSFYLPNSDLSAHRYALEDAAGRDLVADGRTPVEEVPWMMTRHSSNAASDYLGALLGQARLEETAVRLGLTSQTAPCPFLGQFLAMANHTRTVSDAAAQADYLATPALYGLDASRLAEAYATDEAFRRAEIAWRRQVRRPTMPTQQQYSAALGPQATARDYAGLMASIGTNALGSGYLNILVRRYLEWPMQFPVNQERFWTMGYKGGSLPGILTGVYYAEPLHDRTPVVVAIFYRHLPMPTYRQWRRDWPQDELALWLLAEPTAITTLRRLLD